MLPSIEQRLAAEIAAKPAQIAAAIALLDEGATVPFISRYRKEATGGLDDTQLRLLEDRLRYLRELEERREAIIASITEQGKMTPELLKAVSLATDKTHLEDLYLPYKPKRRTKAQIALEAGLEPLADALLANPTLNPEEEAAKYLRDPFTSEAGDANPGVADAKAALDGARQILMERFAEDAGLLQSLREYVQEHGVVQSKVLEGKNDAAEKYADYFDYSESINTIPSHRALAVFRGRREEMLDVQLRLDSEEEKPTWASPHNPCEMRIASRFNIKDMNRPADRWLMDTVRWTWRVKSFMHLESELMGALRSKAETEAINVFARNLKALLLAAPAGPRVTMGLDPGIRTGVKVAVVDETGKVVDTATIYPHQPRNDWDGSLHTLSQAGREAPGGGDLHRQRHGLARDGQAGARPDQAAPRIEDDQHRRFRSGRVGVFRFRIRLARNCRSWMCQLARCGVHRAPPARPAGRAGEDRSQVDRRGPIPARREPVPVGAFAGCGGGRLRQRRGRGCEHGVGAFAGARFRPEQQRGAGHREPARPERQVQHPRRTARSAAPGRQDLRTGGGLLAHHGRQRSARCLGGPPRIVSAGAAHPRRHQAGHQGRDRQQQPAEVAQSFQVCRTRSSASPPSATS